MTVSNWPAIYRYLNSRNCNSFLYSAYIISFSKMITRASRINLWPTIIVKRIANVGTYVLYAGKLE